MEQALYKEIYLQYITRDYMGYHDVYGAISPKNHKTIFVINWIYHNPSRLIYFISFEDDYKSFIKDTASTNLEISLEKYTYSHFGLNEVWITDDDIYWEIVTKFFRKFWNNEWERRNFLFETIKENYHGETTVESNKETSTRNRGKATRPRLAASIRAKRAV